MEMPLPFVAEAVGTVVACLCGAVVHLYRMITKSHHDTQQKLEKCERSRRDMQEKAMEEQRIQYEIFRVEQKETYEKISDLNLKVGNLQGMEKMHDTVIKEVRRAIECHK